MSSDLNRRGSISGRHKSPVISSGPLSGSPGPCRSGDQPGIAEAASGPARHRPAAPARVPVPPGGADRLPEAAGVVVLGGPLGGVGEDLRGVVVLDQPAGLADP